MMALNRFMRPESERCRGVKKKKEVEAKKEKRGEDESHMGDVKV